MRSFVKAREGMASSDTVNAKVMQGFVDSITKQIAGAKNFGAQEAGWLSEALKDSPYGQAHTQTIIAAIDAAVNQ